MDSAKWKNYLPVAAGILSTFVMLQRPEGPPTTSFYEIAQPEIPFFLIGAAIGCLTMPRRPLLAGALILLGVSLGVLLDVVFHPHTKEGFERNLFPFEIAFHTFFAAPCVFAVSVIFWLASFIFTRYRKGGKNA